VLQLSIHPLLPYTSHPSLLLFLPTSRLCPTLAARVPLRKGHTQPATVENGGRGGGREQDAIADASRRRGRGGGGRGPPAPGPLRQGVPAPLPRLQLLARPGSVPDLLAPAFPVTQGIGRALTWCVCCRAGQEGVRKGVELLWRCDEMVSNLGLFSSNESKEDVSTINLKYLLVCPFSFSRICIYSASWCFVESLSYCPVKTTIELFI
jgi:hypothetical protein